MDISSLKTQLNNLDGLRSSLHSSLRFWEWVVVAGVAVEFIVLIKEYSDEWKVFWRATIRLPEKPRTLLFVFGFIGIAMVAGGIARELRVDSKIEGVETQVRGLNGQLFGIVSNEADNALEKSQKAQDNARDVGGKTRQLGGQLKSEEAKLNAVDAKRVELETSLRNLAVCDAPRIIPLWHLGKTESAVSPLTSFPEQKVIIEYVPDDGETRRAAGSLAAVVKEAHWNIVRISPRYDLNDGVEVDPFRAPLPTNDGDRNREMALWQAEIHSQDAAAALVDFLQSYDWQARPSFAVDENGKLLRDTNVFPPDALMVTVGLRPAVTYVAPPGAKELAAWTKKFNESRAQEMNALDRRLAKQEEDAVKNLTPQQAADFKARRKVARENWKKENAALTRRYVGSPCQPLEPLAPSF
jgi:hypothetical protein